MTKAQQTLKRVTAPEYQLLSPSSKAFLVEFLKTSDILSVANELEVLAQVSAMLLADHQCKPCLASEVATHLPDLTYFRQNSIGASMFLP